MTKTCARALSCLAAFAACTSGGGATPAPPAGDASTTPADGGADVASDADGVLGPGE